LKRMNRYARGGVVQRMQGGGMMQDMGGKVMGLAMIAGMAQTFTETDSAMGEMLETITALIMTFGMFTMIMTATATAVQGFSQRLMASQGFGKHETMGTAFGGGAGGLREGRFGAGRRVQKPVTGMQARDMGLITDKQIDKIKKDQPMPREVRKRGVETPESKAARANTTAKRKEAVSSQVVTNANQRQAMQAEMAGAAMQGVAMMAAAATAALMHFGAALEKEAKIEAEKAGEKG
ncbi:uncharacterized protein METZ01_LOCUS496434, partial [marine metagenome]